jgi:hypothetical protein
MMAQKEDQIIIFFSPELSTGNQFIDQKTAESYFNNFDNKKTDGAIISWLIVSCFYFVEEYLIKELAKLIKIKANEFLKLELILRKEKY